MVKMVGLLVGNEGTGYEVEITDGLKINVSIFSSLEPSLIPSGATVEGYVSTTGLFIIKDLVA